MSEAEITGQMLMMMEVTLGGVSLFFTIISAYTVALFYFIGRAPVGLKVTAFAFFSLTLLFLGAFAANALDHAAALRAALVELGAAGGLSPVGERAIGAGHYGRGELDRLISRIVWIGMGLVYVALFFFTFFHRWPARAERRAEE